MKLWQGRLNDDDERLDAFNRSISVDSKMYVEDITGSIAHANMLGETGIVSRENADAIIEGLKSILSDLENGSLEIDETAEDIHTFVELTLTDRIGNAGKMLHTARSRNDQVALDTRLYTKKRLTEIRTALSKLIGAMADIAEKYYDAVMPGYTHLQRAQPITAGHYICAYCYMLLRDLSRIDDALKRMDYCPLGAGALAGTTHPIDRFMTAEALGFTAPIPNSIDAVSDRDFAIEALFCMTGIMGHLSRLSEELVLFSSYEFRFVTLADSFCTGSSIMPQKKNPDLPELVRGKTGRVYGDLISELTMIKSLPLAYNKDMQEDKEQLFDALDTVSACLDVMLPMMETITFNRDRLRRAAGEGFINATDCADYLVRKGVPFREAYAISGRLVKLCISRDLTLETLPLEDYKKESDVFDEEVYEAVKLERCLLERSSYGGPTPESVKAQIKDIRNLNK